MRDLRLKLDDLQFDEMAEIARSQIPASAPRWTDHNVHDPGIMLTELVAWIADAQIYSLGRDRRDERRAYARLMGLQPGGPVAATGMLWPEPALAFARGTVMDPGDVCAVTHSDAPTFRPTASIYLTTCKLARVLTRDEEGAETDFTRVNEYGASEFRPFGAAPSRRARLQLEFSGGAANSPSPGSDIATLAIGIAVAGTEGLPAPAARATRLRVRLRDSQGVHGLEIIADHTGMFTRSGVLLLQVEPRAMAVDDNFTLEIDSPSGQWLVTPRVTRIAANVIPLQQAERLEWIDVGLGQGVPDQELALPTPGLQFGATHATLVRAFESGEWREWTLVEDFENSAPDHRHVLLDVDRAVLRFGNGLNGAALENGAQVQASYDVSQGLKGNLPANMFWTVSGIAGVYGSNPVAMSGGSDAQRDVDLQIAARKLLEDSRPIVSSADLAGEALAFKDLRVSRAQELPVGDSRRRVAGERRLLVLGDHRDDVAPEAYEPQTWLQEIHARLAPRLPTGQRLVVVSPRYVVIDLRATLVALPRRNVAEIAEKLTKHLKDQRFALQPAAGVSEWPLGGDLTRAKVSAWLRKFTGIARVLDVSLFADGRAVTGDIDIPNAGLPLLRLSAGAIRVLRSDDPEGAMSTVPLRQYRFATAAQWRRGLRHRFDAAGDTLRSAPTFHLTASVADATPATLVAAGPGDAVFWRVDEPGDVLRVARVSMRRRMGTAAVDSLELVDVLRVASRWVSDRSHFWAFAEGEATLARVTRRSLTTDLEIDVARACNQALEEDFARVELLDVAGDTRCGVWTLLRVIARAGQATRELLAHFDSRGYWTCHCWLPAGVRDSSEIAVTNRGATLVVLGSRGKILEFFTACDCKLRRLVALAGFGCDWAAMRLSSDGRNRIAIAGGACGKSDQVAVFDGDGDVLQEPLAAGDSVRDLAVGCDRIWLATASGLRLLASGGGAGAARESESLFVAPLLESPITAEGRGWLRAELQLELPAEGSIEAEFAGVDDPDLLRRVRAVLGDGTRSAAERRAEAWNQFDPTAVRRYVFTGKQTRNLPVAIPIFETDARWLLLVLRVIAPPSAATPVVHSLVVRYPERSIAENVPAIYRNRNEDPGGFLRRLMGVLESTTQRVDARIAGIGRSLDPRFASAAMLDYLANWLGIPWDEGLDEASRRRLLSSAAALTRDRGTRAGLRQLLRAVLGDQARIRIGDLTVDHGVLRLGGGACRGAALPALLAGQQRGVATLGERGVLGVAKLPTAENIGSALDPLRTIVPTVRIDVTASRETRLRLQPLLPNLLRQFLPAGVDTVLRWHTGVVDSSDEWALVLDDPGPARLAADQRLGHTRLGGDPDTVLQ